MFKKSLLISLIFFILFLSSSCVHKITQGKWSPIDPLPTARSYSSAQFIDGKIYVFGGGIYTIFKPYVDIYDTETNEWIDSFELESGRSAHASVIVDGEIWLIGGLGSPLPHNDAVAFDPAEKEWRPVATLPWHIDYPEAEKVGDDVYVIGGKVSDFGGKATSATLKLNHETGEFDEIARMNDKRMKHSTAEFMGKIYAFGGVNIRGGSTIDTAEVFDPITNRWSRITPMPTPRQYHESITVGDYIVLCGGHNEDCIEETLSTVDLYLPLEDKWIEGISMNHPRMNFSMTTDGSSIYVFGGTIENDKETTSSMSEVYRF